MGTDLFYNRTKQSMLPHITVMIGTNRPFSLSRIVAHYCLDLLKERGLTSDLIDLEQLPGNMLGSALYANKKKNQVVNELAAQLDRSTKLILIVPQYNGSFPGVLKTFIDAYAAPQIFQGKKCALVGVSKGHQGCIIGLRHLTDILQYLGMTVYPYQPTLGGIAKPDLSLLQAHPHFASLAKQIDGFISF